MVQTMTYPIWMLRLVPSGRWGRWIVAAAILAAGVAIYVPAISIVTENPERWRNYFAWPPARFFVCAIAYIVPTFHFASARAHRALDDLALPPENLEGLEDVINPLTVVKVPDCGHFVPWEAPASVISAMEKFLQP